MRSIYIRSLLFAVGLAAFAAIELFAPRVADAAHSPPVILGPAHRSA